MSTSQQFSAVVACTLNYCIGSNNTLPWPHLKSDLKWLSKLTTKSQSKNAVIMGRLTWESLPFHPLKNRINIVVSSKMSNNDVVQYQDTMVATSFEEALELASSLKAEQIYCLGGAKLYNYAFQHPSCHRIFLTRLNYMVDGDAFLDPNNFKPFKKLSDREFQRVVPFAIVESLSEQGIFFNFECWERSVN